MREPYVLLAILAACEGGTRAIDPTIQFSLQEDMVIDRLAGAAAGFDAELAARAFTTLEQEAAFYACPFVEVSSRGVTLSGSCTGYKGPFNYYFVEGFAHAADSRLEFDGFNVAGHELVDGLFSGRGTYSARETTAELTVDRFDGVVRSVLSIECELDGAGVRKACTPVGGVELVGGGGALVAGTIEPASSGLLVLGNGAWTLEGLDRLDVELVDGCLTWRIEGVGRTHSSCVF